MVAESAERCGLSRWSRVLAALLITVVTGSVTGCAVLTEQVARTILEPPAAPREQPQEQIVGRWRCIRSTIAGQNRQVGAELTFFRDGTFQYRRPGEESTRDGSYRLSRDGLTIQMWYSSRMVSQTLDVEFRGDILVMKGAAYDSERGWRQIENEYSRME